MQHIYDISGTKSIFVENNAFRCFTSVEIKVLSMHTGVFGEGIIAVRTNALSIECFNY